MELALGIPAGVDEGDTERTQATVLCVSLFQIAETANQLLAGDVLVVGQKVTLGGLAGVVDEDVGVGIHACDGADHVAARIDVALVSSRRRNENDHGKDNL